MPKDFTIGKILNIFIMKFCWIITVQIGLNNNEKVLE